jgi:hypothetical protein
VFPGRDDDFVPAAAWVIPAVNQSDGPLPVAVRSQVSKTPAT